MCRRQPNRGLQACTLRDEVEKRGSQLEKFLKYIRRETKQRGVRLKISFEKVLESSNRSS